MTLNIDLEDVPDAILEAVKARIMANRRRLIDNQDQRLSPALRPGPQIRKQGADSRTWRRAEPAAVPNQQPQDFAISYQGGGRIWSANGQDSELLPVTVNPNQAGEIDVPPLPQYADSYIIGADGFIYPGSYSIQNRATKRFYLPAGGRSYILIDSQPWIASAQVFIRTPKDIDINQWAFDSADDVVDNAYTYFGQQDSAASDPYSFRASAYATLIGSGVGPGYYNWGIVHYDKIASGRSTTCFFVSDAVARQVPTPGAIGQALQQLAPGWTTTDASRVNNDNFPSTVKVRLVRPFDGAIYDEYVAYPFPTGAFSTSLQFRTPVDQSSSPPLFAGDLGVFSHFSAKGSWVWTPSILDVFKNPAGTIGSFQDPASANSYRSSHINAQAVLTRLSGTLPFVDVNEQTLIDSQIYERLRPGLARSDDNVYDSTRYFTERTLRPYPAPGQRSAEAVIWDGGDPAYCRQALIDLGFSQQDITP